MLGAKRIDVDFLPFLARSFPDTFVVLVIDGGSFPLLAIVLRSLLA